MNELFEKRINTLRTLISDKKEALFLSNEVNIGYFTGFFHSEGNLLVTTESVFLLVDFRYFEAAQKKAQECKGKPTVIIAETVKGKGVSFMENQAGWHGTAPNDEQLQQALRELGQEG